MKVLSKQDKTTIRAELKQLEKAQRQMSREHKRFVRDQIAFVKQSDKELKAANRVYTAILKKGQRLRDRIDRTVRWAESRFEKDTARIVKRRLVLEGRLS